MITQFGKMLRIIRINNGEVLKDMADKLNVSSSFLSAVETGGKNVPADWIAKLSSAYSLDSEKQSQLEDAALNSVTSVKLNLKSTGASQRNAALVFARDFNDMSDEQAKKILEFFNKLQS